LSLQHAILGLLANESVHGYDLKTAFVNNITPEDEVNFGQIYTILDRLRREGLIEQRIVEQSTRPDRKVYSITHRGRNRLKEWMNSPSPLALDLRNETFLKLMTSRRLKGADPLRVIDVERKACFTRLHEMTRARGQAERDQKPVQTLLLLELAILRLEAFLKWLDQCERVFQAELQA